MFYAVLFLWNTLLSIMTYYNLGSAFLPMLLVAFPLLGRVVLWGIFFGYGSPMDRPTDRNRFVLMYLTSNSIPVLLCSYIMWMHVDFIIPIFGRTGTNDPPELLISVFVTLFALVILSYTVSWTRFHSGKSQKGRQEEEKVRDSEWESG